MCHTEKAGGDRAGGRAIYAGIKVDGRTSTIIQDGIVIKMRIFLGCAELEI